MAYKRGEIKVFTKETARQEWGLDSWEEPADYVRDNRSKGEILQFPLVVLPHSCDNWVVGDERHIRQLVEDLTEVLKMIEEKK